ncbi:penicillin amidase [Scopulibacillus darangshiensis]|uniref:Penicillin amidase n=2 Tax=Scopulibacillus darangshiensis TaxID=442528 RepID=A0A4R2NHX7_9BACL|nr:penicillin amidase [Scopulibacillus darangshiensis]
MVLAVLLLLFSTVPMSSGKAQAGQPQSEKVNDVKVTRDNYGVPHIYATSKRDLYRAYGYVTGKDRLFQLVMFRRGNEGNVSEVFGKKYLAHDEKMRRDGYSDKEIKKMILKMNPFSRMVMKWYAEGINKYVREARKSPDEKLSKEFHDYHVKPRLWTDVDVLRLYMSSMTVFMDQEDEVKNASALEKLKKQHGAETGQKMFNDIFWKNDPAAATSIASTEKVKQDKIKRVNHSFNGIETIAGDLNEGRQSFISYSHELGLPLHVGSNAMVVGPKKSKSGNAMLMGGPQVGLSAPGFMYEVGLHGPGIDIEGSSFIGYPFIMFGATRNFALTATAGYGNVVDIFKEKLNPNNAHQYKYKGKWLNMKKRVETFKVRGEDGRVQKVKKAFYDTVHGPAIAFDKKNYTAYSKAWTFRGTEAESWSAYLKTNWAQNLHQFAKAAREYTMSLNWLYADKHGNIAYFHTGKQPIRNKRVDLRLPTPGGGQYDWKGFKDPKTNPFVINPETGFVANWNNKPSADSNNGELSYNWGADNRSEQYIDQLKATDDITLDKMNDFNYHASLANLRTKHFKPYLLEALKRHIDKNPRYKKVYHYLKDWNNLNEDLNKDGYYDSPAVPIFEAWWPKMVDNLFKSDLGNAYHSLKDTIDHRYGCSLCLRTLQGDHAQLPTQYDWLKVSNDQVILHSLDQALKQLGKKRGNDISHWLTPVRTTKFGEQAIIGVQYGLGSSQPIPEMNRGSENHYVELTKKGPAGHNVTPPGEIGFVGKDGKANKHYDDQIKLYANWKFKPMLFTRDQVKKHAESTHYISFEKR